MNKKFRLNAKNLFLTYPQCEATKSRLLEHLQEKLKDLKYCMIAQETHEDGFLHLHAYCQLSVPCNFNSPKCLDFDGYHGNYAAAKGFYHQVTEYLTKEDLTPLEWGTANKAKSKAEETKQGIAERNKLLATTKLTKLVDEGEIRIENYANIKKSVQMYKMDSAEAGGYMAAKRCYWINDHPDAGKGRRARAIDRPYFSKMQNKWWDGYDQQPIVLLEDFDKQGQCLSHYLKIWADCYSFYGEYKGGTVACNFKVLIITSNYWPEDLWSENDDPQLIAAIKRRFKFLNCRDWDSQEIGEEIRQIVDNS